jgi:phospholipid-binding lipoprotein MlaA
MPSRSTTRRLLRIAAPGLILLAGLLLSACAASRPEASASGFYDPFENVNRKIFSFNLKVDHHVIVPIAKAYRAALRPPVRDSIRDFLRNLRGPIIFGNDVLQAEFRAAGRTLARFVLNSTVGVAGTVDLAGRWGLPYHETDLGVTFGVWGIGPGPYLVLPILGPSDPRDLTGQVAEGFADPWNRVAGNNNYIWIPILRGGVSGIDERSRYIQTLADLERTSLDYYAAIRALYLQRRAALIRHERTLPPNPALARRVPPASGAAPANPAPAPAVLVEARNGSEVSP